MEEEATQQATQVVIDPRRLGQPNSGLSDEDLGDICCILHPSTIPAHKAAACVYDDSPEFTISTDRGANIRTRDDGPDDEAGSFELERAGIDTCDIALRLSANLKDPFGGFYFGRNKQRCDVLIGRNDASKRISNVHFRIYINEFGILMLEDQSTNGTAVDGTLLRGKEKENGHEYRHTLQNGSVIILTMTPPDIDYKFIVRVPQRDEESEALYQNNLTAFFLRLNNLKLDMEARIAAAAPGTTRGDGVNLFPTPTPGLPTTYSSTMSSGRHVKEWRGGQKYNKIGTIGKGAFAVVYKVTAKFDGVPYAAKELEKRRFIKNGILDQKVDSEMKIMRKIKHPNVVQFIEHIDWEEFLYIIMEFVPGGDLGSLINRDGYLNELDVKAMASQMLSALKYLHEMNITHRDVKPDNILIRSRDPFHVKLTDFGLSKMIESEETFLRTFCGTLLYCAPEVYSEYREYDGNGKRNLRNVDKRSLPPQRYGNAVDVWSLAGVLFYALCGAPPFPVKNGTSYQELLNRIMTQPLDIRPLQRANITEQGIRFVRKMLHVRPEHRATIDQLECSSWIIGGDSMEMSMDEDDEVDLVADNSIDDQELEEGASQLSLHHHVDREIGDSLDLEESVSETPELQPREIPSSFNTSDANSHANDSYGFAQSAVQPGGRLFGEVDLSAVGSSGAIPMSQLNLPVPTREQAQLASDPARGTAQTRHIPVYLPPGMPAGLQAGPLTPVVNQFPSNSRVSDSHRPSSLMGAESMVNNLHVHSPASALSPALSPAAGSPATTDNAHGNMTSLRRPREVEYDVDDDRDWRPADLPPKRPRRSSREIDLLVPPTVFWDPADRSTHHTNYPRMMSSDYHRYQQHAESKGERFFHGQKIFEQTMQSFRSSRSPSLEADTRAQSEPTQDEGRRMLMKRDERRLSEDTGSTRAFGKEDFLPVSGPPADAPYKPIPSIESNTTNLHPVVGHDFQPPKRILAKLISTSDSCLPTISLNITETLTSWGRGEYTTVRYVNLYEDRIPKMAFKILVYRPGFYNSDGTVKNPQGWRDDDTNMMFYISTKASRGIWINGAHLPSWDHKNTTTESKWWSEIRHGDIITVFDLAAYGGKPAQNVSFRFECFWGECKVARKPDETTYYLANQGSALLKELEEACLQQEQELTEENRRRHDEDRKVVLEEKGTTVAKQTGKGKQNASV